MTVTVPPPDAGHDERYRLTVLRSLELLDTPPEPEFEAIVQIARGGFGCPIALVSLVDEGRQWFKARCGLAGEETPREHAFCDYAVRADALFVVDDASTDPRFADNPLVTGPPHIRFYAGVPLHAEPVGGGMPAVLGTLCVIDTRPRTLGAGEEKLLRNLGLVAERLIRARGQLAQTVDYAEERRAAAALLDRQHRQLRQAERIAELGSWRLTLADRHIEWSDQVAAIHGIVPRPIGYEEALLFYPPAERARLVAAIEQTLATGEPFDVEIDFTAADGRAKRVRSRGELEVSDGQAIALIGVIQDITARHALEEALRRSATHDELTGIANRAGFNQAIEHRIVRARNQREPLALILLDLDGFKAVNDTHGHAAGDRLLQQIAARLRIDDCPGCFPARLGGDEFALLVSRKQDCARLDAIAAALLAAIERPLDIGGASVAVSATLGIAWLEAGLGAEQLLRRADTALYEGKRAGKARIHAHPSGERRITDRRAG